MTSNKVSQSLNDNISIFTPSAYYLNITNVIFSITKRVTIPADLTRDVYNIYIAFRFVLIWDVITFRRSCMEMQVVSFKGHISYS